MATTTSTTSTTRGKKPKLTSGCAAVIQRAVDDARGALGA
jgi:hypothetical protein